MSQMNEALTDIQELCIAKNLPFVTFRLPKQESCTTFIQTSHGNGHWKSIQEIPGETGFIMAPFDTRNGHPYMIVRPDLVLDGTSAGKKEVDAVKALEGRRAPDWTGRDPVVTGRDYYMEQVDAIKSTIATGAFQKAVLSRIRVISGNYLSIIPRLFRRLCQTHPNAFVYLFRNGGQFWMGASPEPLIRLEEGRISTVSLAGTRPYAEEHLDLNRWNAKEVLEQEYVTRYIHDVLHSFGIRDYRVSSPYVKKAGNLLHLRTDFSLAFEKVNGRLWELVDALHPTPAVAGQPKDEAIRFIRELEPHDREYYTGFLGPVNGRREVDLFVNLRCMKITPGYLSLYVGGGITLDSDPSDEWDETRWKVEALLDILRKYIKSLEPADAAQSTYR